MIRRDWMGCALLACVVSSAKAEEIRLPIGRDTWFSGVGPEVDANLGGSPKLKLKSYQEISLVDVDPAPIRGRVVLGATFHLKKAAPPILRRVTVGTFGSDWVEGTSPSYGPQDGASTFRRREHPDVPWTLNGGDLCDVILGQGGTAWRSADASPPDAEGWQTIAVDPLIVAARVAGISRGFLLFDDTGTEWTRSGNTYTVEDRPNRFVASRDSNRASAPYLTVKLGPEDRSAPMAPGSIASDVGDLPAGEAVVSWTTPGDPGPAGTIGFLAEIDGKPAPRAMIPMAGKPGDRVSMRLRDLKLKPGAGVELAIRAVDASGNVGPEARASVVVSSRVAKPLPDAGPPIETDAARPIPFANTTVLVVDELDKRDPVTRRLIGTPGPDDRSAGHLWDSANRSIRIEAARNEFVAFQVLFDGPVAQLRPTLSFDRPEFRVEFGRPFEVATPRGPMPDPVLPMSGAVDLQGSRGRSLYVEVYVPHDAPSGDHRGTLTLQVGGESLALTVALKVWDFTLPDTLSFLPEMNCYGLPDSEREYYRMAHRHRTAINRVPYSQRGDVGEGLAPKVVGDRLDWSGYDARFGPLLDGSAFADLPRKSVPIEVFYLPLHENWPTPIEGNYNGGYWADRAFTDSYRRAFVATARQFAEHCDEKGWHSTIFQGFLNNKMDFKRGARGWSGGSSPWLLDEPASFQDFWALRYFGSAFHEGVAAARAAGKGRARMAFRADISRPQWQRDSLDGLLDYNVVGSEFRDRRRMVLDRKREQGQMVLEYGGSNPVEASNVQPAAWCVDAWSLGVDGIIPWQTIGKADSWNRGDELALFYPPRPGVDAGPVPSLRLKAYRRGQQDVEYLAMLAEVEGEPRWAVGDRVREALQLRGDRRGAGAEAGDAGSIRYGKLGPGDLWSLRYRVGRALSDARPAPKRRSEGWRPPARDPMASADRR